MNPKNLPMCCPKCGSRRYHQHVPITGYAIKQFTGLSPFTTLLRVVEIKELNDPINNINNRIYCDACGIEIQEVNQNKK